MTKRVKIGYRAAREIYDFYRTHSNWYQRNRSFDALNRAISKVEQEEGFDMIACRCEECKKIG
jgi:hypothetical protein